MELTGTIINGRVHVLIDSGATHCFIAEQTALSLHLPITQKSDLPPVTLLDGSTMPAKGICRNVLILLDYEPYTIDCTVVPLKGFDVVLGISWLSTLGDVKVNWMNFSMEYIYNGNKVQLVNLHPDKKLRLLNLLPDQNGYLSSTIRMWSVSLTTTLFASVLF